MSKIGRMLRRLERLESRKKEIKPLAVQIIYRDGSTVPYDVFESWSEEERERFAGIHDVGEWKLPVKERQ